MAHQDAGRAVQVFDDSRVRAVLLSCDLERVPRGHHSGVQIDEYIATVHPAVLAAAIHMVVNNVASDPEGARDFFASGVALDITVAYFDPQDAVAVEEAVRRQLLSTCSSAQRRAELVECMKGKAGHTDGQVARFEQLILLDTAHNMLYLHRNAGHPSASRPASALSA